MNFYRKYGVEKVVNASGTMTSLGSSPVPDTIMEEVDEVADKFVRISELQAEASRVIAEVTGAEAGCVTACAAAGICLGVASAMTGVDLGKIYQLPDTEGLKNRVLVQKGHSVDFGAPVSQMIRLAGAQVDEFGSVNHVSTRQMWGAITDDTGAAVYVSSHHAVQHGQIAAKDFIDTAHRAGVPVVVDAAADYHFDRYLDMGADLVTCSGHKFLYGLTSGLVAGEKKLVQGCYLQQFGIGRSMKVGKEGIVSLIASLKAMADRDPKKEEAETRETAERLVEGMEDIQGIAAYPVEDPTGSPIVRVKVEVQETEGIGARILARELESAGTPIITRSHHVDEGFLKLETRFLDEEEIGLICSQIEAVMKKPSSEKEKLRTKYGTSKAMYDLQDEARLRWPDI